MSAKFPRMVGYILPEHYLRRNPHAAYAGTHALVSAGPEANRLYPASDRLQLFRLSGPPGRPTAVCGLGVYRDERLGKDYSGNVLVCEPVNLLVHRMLLSPRGSTFATRRADSEKQSEFLASTDAWFRPVQVRTGPDGALWVVDMYRFVIEHPRWIPAEDLARLDVRAGHNLGRIYRIRPAGSRPGALPRLDKLDAGLVAALDNSNGTRRDLAGQMLLWRKETSAADALTELAVKGKRAEGRLQALCVLDTLGKVTPELLWKAMRDPDAGVRRHAVRLAEPLLAKDVGLRVAAVRLVGDPDAQVRLQLAFTLGAGRDQRMSLALAKLARQGADDAALSSAVLSSLHAGNVTEVLEAVMLEPWPGPHGGVVRRVLEVAVGLAERKKLPRGIDKLLKYDGNLIWRFLALPGLLDGLQRRGETLADLSDRKARAAIVQMLEGARLTATRQQGKGFGYFGGGPGYSPDLLPALGVLGRDPASRNADRSALAALLTPRQSVEVQTAALAGLGRIPDVAVADDLLDPWEGLTPAVRAQVLDLLLGRDAWQRRLLVALEKKTVPPGQIDAARRQRLLAHRDEQVRRRASKVFNGPTSADRQKVLRDHADVAAMKGDGARGKTVFARACATCHVLEGVGHAVGPDLAALANRTAAYLLIEILDPNRNVDSRYLQYTAITTRGRSLTGILAAETATSITLREQEGREHVLLRADLESLTSTGKSLMPEGLEKDLKKQDLADLIAYLSVPAKNPAALAQQILDEKFPSARRQALIEGHADQAAELVEALAAGLKSDAKEEYRHIPWIWRVAIAAGKRNDAATLKKLLSVSLPKAGEPLRHWQAVVVGGGIINGVSLTGAWPGPRLDELVRDSAELKKRWDRARELAAAMADDARVPAGTRYDALRMIALGGWEKRGAQLAKYLARGTSDELMMGAISGLSDIDSPKVAPLLLGGLSHFPPGNRKLALDALLRTGRRATALLDALQAGKVPRTLLSAAQVKALRGHKNQVLRQRAEKVLD